MYSPIVFAPITDLIIWYLGIYGLAWTIVFSYIFLPLRKRIFEYEIVTNHIFWRAMAKLITCIVCTSFWCAAILVGFYFNQELFLTKTLIAFSNVAFTWFMAAKFGDYDEDY